MRILFLGINYWPEETGIAVFNTGRCEYLAACGHQVTICTGFPYYPQWQVATPYRGRLFTREVRNGVTLLRSYLYVPCRVTAVKRVLHEASFIVSSCLRASTAQRPELLVTVSPPLGLALSTILLSRLWQVPYVFHVPDLQPDAALDLGMLPAGKVGKVLYALERMAYRHAGLISTLTETMQNRIVSKGVPAEKVTLFPDWVDPACFSVPVTDEGQAFRRAHGLDGQFLMVHCGNMGVKQGLEVILGAAERSRDRPDLTYLLVGDGAARPTLEERTKALRLANVRFLPLQPKEVFCDLLAAADVCLVTQRKTVMDIVFPSKVITLLAAGRPVLASVNTDSEVARVVRGAKAGDVVAAEDPQALLAAILKLRALPETARLMRINGRIYARGHWEREQTLAAMEDRLLQMIGENPSVRREDVVASPDEMRA